MILTAVEIHVKQEHIHDFIEATITNHRGALQEPGCLRFDLLQSLEDPAFFMLHETYESQEAAALHKKTAHYLTWRDAVAPWMEKPRTSVVLKVIAPAEVEKWK